MSYCTIDEVNNLFGDISDDITEDMFNTVIDNAEGWINANLQKNYVPIPTNNPQALRTASIYFAASDILLSLYHGEELPTTYDIWYQKAQSLLDDYIEAYLNAEAEETELLLHQMVKHSHGKTYRRNIRYG